MLLRRGRAPAMTPVVLPPGGAAPSRTPVAGAALDLRGIDHRYGDVLALASVDLAVAAGEIVCVVGPSGCGKSTLLRLAAGLEDLQTGSVSIDGRQVASSGPGLPPERRSVGLVFQDYALFPHLSVRDNVAFGLIGLGPEARLRQAMDSLEQVGMARYADMFPHTLSGGQQQRVALARALAPRPNVMLLDEPFSGLDVILRDRVRDETLHILKKSGAATLLVTHDPEEAMFLADRIALLDRGRLVQVGAPVDLYCRPQTPFVARFFGEVNQVRGRVDQARVLTPVGAINAADLPDGTPVDVLIRPEALHLDVGARTDGGGGVGRVEAARLLGRTSLVHLSVADGTGSVHMHARVPGPFLPAEGAAVSIQLDPRQAFVFPSGQADGAVTRT